MGRSTDLHALASHNGNGKIVPQGGQLLEESGKPEPSLSCTVQVLQIKHCKYSRSCRLEDVMHLGLEQQATHMRIVLVRCVQTRTAMFSLTIIERGTFADWIPHRKVRVLVSSQDLLETFLLIFDTSITDGRSDTVTRAETHALCELNHAALQWSRLVCSPFSSGGGCSKCDG